LPIARRAATLVVLYAELGIERAPCI